MVALDHLQQPLRTGISQLGLQLDDKQQKSLLDYLELLAKWNRAYNLTAVRQPEDMLSRHLLDSLSVSPHLQGDHFLDVGTGPGLPGIPLAICCPEKQFTLLDSNGKKTRFLHQAVLELGLRNVQVNQSRIESFHTNTPFDGILSRAFSTLLDMVEGCYRLCQVDGRFLAMKGIYPEQELADLFETYPQLVEEAIHPLHVPGCDGERHLVVLRKAQP